MTFEQRSEGIEGAYYVWYFASLVFFFFFFLNNIYWRSSHVSKSRASLFLVIALYSMLWMYPNLFNQMTLNC